MSHDVGVSSLYRHALETLMKTILTAFGPHAGINPEIVLQRSHNLQTQLPDLMAVAARVGRRLCFRFDFDITTRERVPRSDRGGADTLCLPVRASPGYLVTSS